MKAWRAVVYLTIFLSFAASGFAMPSGAHIDDALRKLNNQIRSDKLALKELDATDLKKWLTDILPLTLMRQERQALEQSVNEGRLPAHWQLKIIKSDGMTADRVLLNTGAGQELPVLVGNRLSLFSDDLKLHCVSKLCDEPFKGDIPRGYAMDFPKNVPIAITEIQASGEPLGARAVHDALWIQIHLNKKNLVDVAGYFAVGRAYPDLYRFLEKRLGARSEVWIDLQEIFQNWLTYKVNRVPMRADHLSSFAVAREFYFDRQSVPALSEADSQETFVAFLSQHYCALPDTAEPRFGDILFVPGVHAGRFILKDPVSGRGIGLSLYPMGSYRFWWIDEDFASRPFAKTPERDLRLKRVDYWRRCK